MALGDWGEVCSGNSQSFLLGVQGREAPWTPRHTKNRPRALFTQWHIWFHSHRLWIIMQFSFVVWFVCLFFKNSHFLCPRFSKHPHALPFPDGKSFEGVPISLACPHFPISHLKLMHSADLTMGFILEYFLFFRAESTWEYYSWCEWVTWRTFCFEREKKINQGKKSKFFRVKCRGSEIPNEKLKPMWKGWCGELQTFGLVKWHLGSIACTRACFQPLTQMGKEFSPWNVIYTYPY